MGTRKKLKAQPAVDVIPPWEQEQIDGLPSDASTALVVAPERSTKRSQDTETTETGELQTATESKITDAAKVLMNRNKIGGSELAFEGRFRSNFGASPQVAARVWDLLQQEQADMLTDLHTVDRFLWALFLLKSYDTNSVNAGRALGVHEDTFSLWAWDFVERICELETVVIVWENRRRGDEGNDCMSSVDGTDCPFQINLRSFISHKFKKGGLRYLVLISIKHGDIVWIDGPFPAGFYNDIKCLRWSVLNFLDDNERIEGDDGFIGECPAYVKCPGSFAREDQQLAMQSRVRARHENVNKRLKQWGCLTQKFRHDFDKHACCFRAVAVMTQLSFEFGEPLWDVEYSDLPRIEATANRTTS